MKKMKFEPKLRAKKDGLKEIFFTMRGHLIKIWKSEKS